jgi:transposase
MMMFHQPREAAEMKISMIGIDLAKQSFQAHGVDERGKSVLKKSLKRHQSAEFFGK